MKYIGNYKSCIPEGLIETLKDSDGFEITDYQVFESDLFNFEIPTLPEQRKITNWSIFKFNPGQLEYTHNDQFLLSALDPIKFIMFLNDWEIGHIFTCGGDMCSGYKAGDMYQIDDRSAIYSWANIGYSNSHVLEIKLCNDYKEEVI